jgi:F-type H+-transporting ATPase subunit delta
MSGSDITKPYATALFEIALKRSAIYETEEELRVVRQVFLAEKKLISLLLHPKVSAESKKSLIKQSFAAVSEPVLNTLFLMIDRHRIQAIPELSLEFSSLANRARQTEDAVVYSVKPLKEKELTALSEAFANKAGVVSLRVRNEVNPDLIGGVKIRIGNRIYDGSISGKLARIERQLSGEIS